MIPLKGGEEWTRLQAAGTNRLQHRNGSHQNHRPGQTDFVSLSVPDYKVSQDNIHHREGLLIHSSSAETLNAPGTHYR